MPKKVDFAYYCDAYEQSHQFLRAKEKGARIEEQCVTCRWLMFGLCWLSEANKDDKTVINASQGFDIALKKVYKRVQE